MLRAGGNPGSGRASPAVSQRASRRVQPVVTTIGALADDSSAVFSRNRPSRETAYCALLPMTFRPLARRVWNSATGDCGAEVLSLRVTDTDIILPSGAM